MGIDITGKSMKLPKNFPFRAKGKNALRLIEKAARKWAASQGLGGLYVSQYWEEKQLIINLYPTAGDIVFEVDTDSVSVDLRTSQDGAGYHAAVVGMLQEIGKGLDCAFNLEDDTGYASHKEFQKLKDSFTDYLVALMAAAKEQGSDDVKLNLPLSLSAIETSGKVLTPLGPVSTEYPDLFDGSDGKNLEELCEDYFIWWGEEKTASFWEKLLRAQLWQKVQWRQPLDDQEVFQLSAVEYLVGKYQGQEGALPNDLENAVSELKIAVQSNFPPSKEGIGYLRLDKSYSLFDKWSLNLPACFVEIEGEEDASYYFTQGTVKLEISYLFTELSEGGEYVWPSNLSLPPKENEDGVKWASEVDMLGAGAGKLSSFTVVAAQNGQQVDMLMISYSYQRPEQLGMLDKWLESAKLSEH